MKMIDRGRQSRAIAAFVTFVFLCFLPIEAQQSSDSESPEIQQLQRVFAEKEKKQHTYEWIETTTISLDGRSRPSKESLCKYGPDGKIQKTPLGSQSTATEQRGLGGPLRGGLIRRMVTEKKKKDAEQNAEKVRELSRMYLPLDRAKLKDAFASGRASLNHAQNQTEVVIRNYAKKGDEIRLTFNAQAAQLEAVSVKTYLDKRKETVTASMKFATLDDGATYPSSTTMHAPSKKLSLSTTSSDFAKPTVP